MFKKKRILVFIFVFASVIVLILYNGASIAVKKENRHRYFIATGLKNSIETYFFQNQKYPENVFILDVPYIETVQDFLHFNIIEYKTDSSLKEWYAITCRYSKINILNISRPKFSNYGIQYSNNIKRLPQPLPEYRDTPMMDKNGFYQAVFVE